MAINSGVAFSLLFSILNLSSGNPKIPKQSQTTITLEDVKHKFYTHANEPTAVHVILILKQKRRRLAALSLWKQWGRPTLILPL